VLRLLQKLDEVYGFITQDDNLAKIESMRNVVGKIAQQTLECARFIRDYSETKNFCESSGYCISHTNYILTMIIGKRVGKNILAETDDIITRYNDALDGLMQQFRDQVDRDVAIFVQFAGKDSHAPLILVVLMHLKVRHSISAAWFMQEARD
jgi:hypothetical protein